MTCIIVLETSQSIFTIYTSTVKAAKHQYSKRKVQTYDRELIIVKCKIKLKPKNYCDL